MSREQWRESKSEIRTGFGYGPILEIELTPSGIMESRDSDGNVVVMVYAPNAGSVLDEGCHDAIGDMAESWEVDCGSYVDSRRGTDCRRHASTPLRYVTVNVAESDKGGDLALEILRSFQSGELPEGAEDRISATVALVFNPPAYPSL
jgi:hypothetical protein